MLCACRAVCMFELSKKERWLSMLPPSCLIDGGKSPLESLGTTFRLPLLQLLGASIPLGKQYEASSPQTGFSVRALMPPPAQSALFLLSK